MRDIDVQTASFHSSLHRLLGAEVCIIDTLGGGRNSQVYLVRGANTGLYVAKRYFRHASDPRDRLQVEFSTLRFLWDNGLRSIPQPVAADRDHDVAVYRFIDGRPIGAHEVTTADIEAAVDFLVRLERLKRGRAAGRFPAASEACFSIPAIVDSIDRRLRKLSAPQDLDTPHAALRQFIQTRFVPAYLEIRRWCRSRLQDLGLGWSQELPAAERTLSPSDFGFHNAVRTPDGRIVFLDFEYFGWDDPAKMIVDFLLHPGMNLGDALKQRFVTHMLTHFAPYTTLPARVKIVYPLFALKWCVILLNEFVPEYRRRRRFAVGPAVDTNARLTEQLAKANRMLQRTTSHDEYFPYDV